MDAHLQQRAGTNAGAQQQLWSCDNMQGTQHVWQRSAHRPVCLAGAHAKLAVSPDAGRGEGLAGRRIEQRLPGK